MLLVPALIAVSAALSSPSCGLRLQSGDFLYHREAETAETVKSRVRDILLGASRQASAERQSLWRRGGKGRTNSQPRALRQPSGGAPNTKGPVGPRKGPKRNIGKGKGVFWKPLRSYPKNHPLQALAKKALQKGYYVDKDTAIVIHPTTGKQMLDLKTKVTTAENNTVTKQEDLEEDELPLPIASRVRIVCTYSKSDERKLKKWANQHVAVAEFGACTKGWDYFVACPESLSIRCEKKVCTRNWMDCLSRSFAKKVAWAKAIGTWLTGGGAGLLLVGYRAVTKLLLPAIGSAIVAPLAVVKDFMLEALTSFITGGAMFAMKEKLNGCGMETITESLKYRATGNIGWGNDWLDTLSVLDFLNIIQLIQAYQLNGCPRNEPPKVTPIKNMYAPDDTCETALDDECDEIHACEAGTDCTDCGTCLK